MDRERITRVFFFGFLALMGYELYSLLSPFLVPIAWAMLLAFIVHPAFLRLMRVVRSPTAAALLFTAMLALILALPTVWLSGKLATEASKAVSFGEFMRYGPAHAGKQALRSGWVISIEKWLENQGLHLEDLQRWMSEGSTYIADYFAANAATIARNLVSFVVALGIMLFSFFYLLRDGEEYYEFVRALTPLDEEDKAMVFETLRAMLSSTVRGLLLTALFEGLLLGLGYLVTGMPDWLLLGALSGAAGLLPIGGTALVWIPAGIYLGATAGWAWAIGLMVWGTIVVVVIDNLLKPITVGQGSGLPAVALFFGITGGLEVYGPLGIFAGPAVIAVFAALIRVYRRSYAARPPVSPV
jgi:predicted PurR-regulated permease PerM